MYKYWTKLNSIPYEVYLFQCKFDIVELFFHRQHTQLFKSNIYIYYSIFYLLPVLKP
jgi:hypothetical protein